jgi:16S rRNA processing protein RimM
MSDTLITIGKIVAPHGVRGDVRVIPLTDFPERFTKLKSVLIDDRTLIIQGVRYHKQFVLLKFRDIDSINEVECLRGKLLQIQRKDVAPLPEGRYYQFEIIGLAVYNEQDECLGTITEILETGSNDVYVVENRENKQILVPALKDVVKKIDIPSGKMIVKLQEEWE